MEEIKKKNNKKTKLIILVHLYGDMPNLYKINKILIGKKIHIIEDASSMGLLIILQKNP